MAREKLYRRECDTLDVAAVWPCAFHIGWMPIPEIDSPAGAAKYRDTRIEEAR